LYNIVQDVQLATKTVDIRILVDQQNTALANQYRERKSVRTRLATCHNGKDSSRSSLQAAVMTTLVVPGSTGRSATLQPDMQKQADLLNNIAGYTYTMI